MFLKSYLRKKCSFEKLFSNFEGFSFIFDFLFVFYPIVAQERVDWLLRILTVFYSCSDSLHFFKFSSNAIWRFLSQEHLIFSLSFNAQFISLIALLYELARNVCIRINKTHKWNSLQQGGKVRFVGNLSSVESYPRTRLSDSWLKDLSFEFLIFLWDNLMIDDLLEHCIILMCVFLTLSFLFFWFCRTIPKKWTACFSLWWFLRFSWKESKLRVSLGRVASHYRASLTDSPFLNVGKT